MNPGELKHRITIQQLSNTQDSFGQPVESWADVAQVWANINPIAGKEYFAAETVNSELTHKIRLRYRIGIKANMRVIYKDRTFQIVSIINEYENNAILQLMCRELI